MVAIASPASPAKHKASCFGLVKRYVRQAIKDQPELAIPDVSRETLAHFRFDNGFLSQFAAERLPDMIYRAAQEVVAEDRRISLDNIDVPDMQAIRGWLNWPEHIGTRHIRLANMTKNDLLTAQQIRFKTSDYNAGLARLWGELAARLNEGETVGMRFTDTDIEGIRLKLKEESVG